MSMPPSGVEGLMDEEALIEAEIQLELENINLDADNIDDAQLDNEVEEEALGEQDVVVIPDELDDYIKRLQDQTTKFEQELLECDELLSHSTAPVVGSHSTAMIPYDDHNLLVELARENGCDIDQYRLKILEDIENDEDIITDELSDLIGSEPSVTRPSLEPGEPVLQITENGELNQTGSNIGEDSSGDGISRHVQKAVEEGLDAEEVSVGQNSQANAHVDIQRVLREQLDRLEERYQGRMDKIKKEEAYKRDEEEVRRQRTDEERQWKKQEIERQEQQIILERQMAERRIEMEQETAEKEMQLNMKKFEAQMAELQAETERQRAEHNQAVEQERHRQTERQNTAVLLIQSVYRGYRVRKEVKADLDEKKDERRKHKEEERIKEIEIEIVKRNEEKDIAEQKERERKEEEKQMEEEAKRLKEEEKKQKEIEKQRIQEEKKRQKEEEERQKQEEKMRKEEDKRKRKEEEKRKKEEEKLRKEEEKRQKEEEKKKKAEEEKRRKEEEKRLKEEEKRLKEEEKKKKEDDDRKKKEEENRKKEEKNAVPNEKHINDVSKGDDHNCTSSQDNTEAVSCEATPVEINKTVNPLKDDNHMNAMKGDTTKLTDSNVSIENKDKLLTPQCGEVVNNMVNTEYSKNDELEKDSVVSKVIVGTVKKDSERLKTPRSARKPHPPSPRKRTKESSESLNGKTDADVKTAEKHDSLPEPLEELRLTFMKQCLPWSKVSNEPWKLRAGSSKKPLRRPSSAKKLPLLQDDIIIQAARVASLKQVTTVQLSDLPGNNISSLGQCWGLKYLSMNRCNLVAIDGLAPCKQLQFLDVKNNKISFLDVRDLGKLQYVNVSHNLMTSVHGLDNCTNLRWLDLSYNNITRLGGLETLRRLHTLQLSHNQLISGEGLGDTPTLQMIDMSYNHLQDCDQLSKLCLLVSLDLSSNNLLKIPSLSNQVLIQDLLLNDNSISSLDQISATWLPLLNKLHLSQNSVDELPKLQNCLLIKDLDISSNQLLDAENIHRSLDGCIYLQNLYIDDNPVDEDLPEGFYVQLQNACPRLLTSSSSGSPHKTVPLKPRTSFEAMCLTQCHTLRDIMTHLDMNLKSLQNGGHVDLAQLCDVYFKFCEKTFNIVVEQRYAHEYGDVSITMPTAPTTPRSSRPLSGRQKDKFMNPKDMFENALKSSNKPTDQLSNNSHNGSNDIAGNSPKYEAVTNPKDLFEQSLRQSSSTNASFNNNKIEPANYFTQNNTNPKDLFDQALKSSESSVKSTANGHINGTDKLTNGAAGGKLIAASSSKDQRARAAVVIQAFWRGWSMRREIAEQTKVWLAAVTIQAAWRGYAVRGIVQRRLEAQRHMQRMDPQVLQQLNQAAVKIQALWRGYILRKKLFAALEYAQCNFGDDDDDEDAQMFDEFDIDKFVDIDEGLLDDEWKPPETPDIPANHPVLRKPPSGRQKVPPLNTLDHQRPPSNPRRAWKNLESPLSDIARIPRPPSSVASTELTSRTAASKKEEKLTEEWGFKDTNTAHLMMQRAKKMKYNAERRKKINKLDPKQRLALFRKLEETTHPETRTIVPQRKTLPRKEYFQARQNEINRADQEKRQEFHTRASRTFEWLHTQVGDHPVTDSIINQTTTNGPKYMHDLPELQGGRRVQLVSSPASMELQSVDSVSSAGLRPRRSSTGAGYTPSKLPPIQTASAPTAHLKERMSFRNPKQNESVGWGGGKKRTSRP